MNLKKKQPAKKRAYTKKAARWSKKYDQEAIENISLLEPPVPPREEKDKEVEQLTLICEVIESWSEAQKFRCLQFMFSKYGKYSNQFKIG